MNKEEIEEDNRAIKISMPLLTEEEMLKIDNNFNEIVDKIKNQFIKEKDLVIAQYIINKQQNKLEQKETILDKVTDKLKEDIENDYCIEEYISNEYGIIGAKKYSVKPYTREILNIIEGEKKYCCNCGVELNSENRALNNMCNECKYGLDY